MFAYSNQYVTDNVVANLLTKGNTIIVRNKLDTLGRVNQNQILIEDKELLTKYDYNKTRVSKQTLHNEDSITYSYDSMNNITSKTTSENGVESKVQYTYDQLGRLKSETRNDEVERFTYYPNGNIRYREVIRNNVMVIKEEYQYDTVIKDRLLRIKDLISNSIIQDITYDSRFVFNPKQMLINGILNTLTWEGRRLTGITGSTYQYSSEGIRTKKIKSNETTTFELEGSNIISMNKITSTENIRLDFVYDESAALIGVNTIEGHYFYIRDITGNILGLIDNEGKYIVKYKYDAWGKVLEKKILEESIISRHNPFVYKGYFLDEETGFYYLKSRYYDPVIRRFISIDSPQYINQEDLSGLNLYAYCGNNPVNKYDPTGHDWNSFWNSVGNWFKNTFGAFVGISEDIISAGQDFFFGGWEQGTRTNITIGDDSKPFSVYVTKASEWWKFWEYQVGFKINIGKFSCSASIGLGEMNTSFGWDNTTLDIQFGINKIGIGTSHTSNGMTSYSQYYIRTIPTVLALVAVVAVIVFAPQFLPAVGPALGFI